MSIMLTTTWIYHIQSQFQKRWMVSITQLPHSTVKPDPTLWNILLEWSQRQANTLKDQSSWDTTVNSLFCTAFKYLLYKSFTECPNYFGIGLDTENSVCKQYFERCMLLKKVYFKERVHSCSYNSGRCEIYRICISLQLNRASITQTYWQLQELWNILPPFCVDVLVKGP